MGIVFFLQTFYIHIKIHILGFSKHLKNNITEAFSFGYPAILSLGESGLESLLSRWYTVGKDEP